MTKKLLFYTATTDVEVLIGKFRNTRKNKKEMEE